MNENCGHRCKQVIMVSDLNKIIIVSSTDIVSVLIDSAMLKALNIVLYIFYNFVFQRNHFESNICLLDQTFAFYVKGHLVS